MIWHLIDSRSIGGAERHIGIVISCLRKKNIDAEAVLYRDYGKNPWFEQLAANRVPFHILGGTPRHLAKALARERPSILHTHGYKAGILGRLPARLLGIPVVSTFHSGERSAWPVGLYEWVDEWTAGLGQRIAVSPAVQSRLPLKSTVIANFIPDCAPPPEVSLPRRVAFVGRLTAEKAPELFCALASRAAVGLEWHIYGDGPLRHELERRYGNIVHFHGVVADLAQVWPSIGLLVMPSRFEGLPFSALEALAAGVPILATRVGGLPSVVIEQQTGWLFDIDDAATALAKLNEWRMLDQASQRRMRLSCWTHANNNFSEDSELPKLLSVYAKAEFSNEGRT